MNSDLIKIAHAEGSSTEAVLQSETLANGKKAEEHSGGISIDPAIVGWQIFNLLVLLLILKVLLYKPLIKLLTEREQKIKLGVEHAEEAEVLLTESRSTREKMLKETRAEGQGLVDTARKSGEQVRSDIIAKAQEEAQHLLSAGKQAIDSEKAKALLEVRTQAVDMVIMATEKLMREKLDVNKDSKLINEALQSYAK